MTRDRWSGGDDYESFVGRWSRAVAREFIPALDVPAGARWVDVGCGTGALSAATLDFAAPASIVGVDPSADFLAVARAAVPDPRATFLQGGAAALPVADGVAESVVSGLVLNWIPDLPPGLAEMRRATAAGGLVAGYVWDYAGRMELIRRFFDAAIEVDERAIDEDEGSRFPLCSPSGLTAAFEAAGLEQVATWGIEVPTVFRDFDDYWRPFETGVGAAPAYAMRLDVTRREAIRDRLRATLPTASDGSIHLVARAWAVRGTTGAD